MGFFTLVAAVAVGRHGRVYAFEPAPDTANELRANVTLNSLDQVEVFELAVCASVGLSSWSNGRNSLSARLGEGSMTVQTTTLDALDLLPPTLVKIDVEGAEQQVIAGMKEIIDLHRPTILCEMHMVGPVEHAATQLATWLPGYSVEPLESGWAWAPHLLATPDR